MHATPKVMLAEWKAGLKEGPFCTTKQIDAITTTLTAYAKDERVADLEDLDDAVCTWKLLKNRTKGLWGSSKRCQLVEKLTKWIVKEGQEKGLFPKPEAVWGDTHNCYAYAMKCDKPENTANGHPQVGAYATGDAVPAARKGEPKENESVEERFARDMKSLNNDDDVVKDYHERLIAGVVADSLKLGKEDKVIVVARKFSDEGFDIRPVPAPIFGGKYLVAMVGKPDGFHFLRRDEMTRLWTHKNGGNHSPVETSVYDRTQERYVKITDEVVAGILAIDPRYMTWLDPFHFVAFFWVPDSGITVSGGKKKKND